MSSNLQCGEIEVTEETKSIVVKCGVHSKHLTSVGVSRESIRVGTGQEADEDCCKVKTVVFCIFVHVEKCRCAILGLLE